jgi:hypothetical protein
MKTMAAAALILGVVLSVPSIASADGLQCEDTVTSAQTHPVPPWCPIGDEYDAGDVDITRICRDATTFAIVCTTSWIESYMHRVGSDCGDGGFVEQLDARLDNNVCP